MGVAQVFVGKIFVHRLQTTKLMKLPLKNYPLYSDLVDFYKSLYYGYKY